MRRAGLVLLAAALWLPGQAGAGMRARHGGEPRVLLSTGPVASDPARLSTADEVAVAGLVHGRLFGLDRESRLSAELAEAVPEPEASGRLFRIRLRAGLEFQDGSAIGGRDVVASLARLAAPRTGSPHAVIALPLVGAGHPSGRVIGLAVAREGEVRASLAFPYPDWPRALAHPAASILPANVGAAPPVGAGPFALLGAAGGAGPRLVAFDNCPEGRPFVDGLKLDAASPRSAARAMSLGEADVALLPVPGRNAAEGPALFTTYLAFNPARLGERARPLARAVESAIDVRELTRLFVRGPAVPMSGLLPPALEVAPPVWRRPSPLPSLSPGPRVSLAFDESVDEHRAVAERVQLALHDAGVAVQLRPLSRDRLRRVVAEGDHELALVSFAALPEPGMALAQLVHFSEGRDAAKEVLRVVGAGADEQARRARAAEQAASFRARLPLVPLYAQAPVAVAGAGLTPVGFDGCGVPSLAGVWFAGPKSAP